MTDEEKMLLELSIRLLAIENILVKNKIILKEDLLSEITSLGEQMKEQLKS